MGHIPTEKTCGICRELLPPSAFWPRKRDGLQNYCIACATKANEQWRRKRGIKPLYRHPPDTKMERWCHRHQAYRALSEFGLTRSSCLACIALIQVQKSGGYRIGPRGRLTQLPVSSGQRRCTRCRETLPLTNFYFVTRTHDTYLSYCKQCGAKLRQKHAKRAADNRKLWSRILRAEVLAAYGGRCRCCGETESVFLAIDHVKEDGATHRRQLRGNLYLWLKRQGFPQETFQLLCYNCNRGKYELGQCPHQASQPMPAALALVGG